MSFPDLVFSTAPDPRIRRRRDPAGAAAARSRRLPRAGGLARAARSALPRPASPAQRRRSSASTRPRARTLPLAVVGTGADPDAAALRDAVGTGIRTLTGFSTVARRRAVADDARCGARPRRARPSAATASTATSPRRRSPARRASSCTVRREPAPEELAAVTAAADAVALVKDLVSIPAEWLGPADFAERAVASVADLPVTVEVLDEAALRDARLRRHPRRRPGIRPAAAPRSARLRARGRRRATSRSSARASRSTPAACRSSRPASMVGMKYDMCGAATALAVLRAVATLGAAGPGHRVAVHRRQHALRSRDAARGCAAHARRHDRRGAQHRCRGPARARRRPRRGEPGAPGRDRRRRHADRRDHDRAGHPPRRRHGRRRRGRRVPRRRGRDRRARLAASAPGAHGRRARLPHRRPAEREDRRPRRRVAVRRAVPAPLRRPHVATRPTRRASPGCTWTSPASA